MNQTNGPLKDKFHRTAWRLIHLINFAGDQPSLNRQNGRKISPQPHQELFMLGRQVKASAISEDGLSVDYKSLGDSDEYRRLRRFTNSLPACSLTDIGDGDAKLAFWINIYNVLILDGIIHYQIEDRVPFSLFQRAAYNVCGHRFSADDIEHGILRGNRPHPVYRIKPFSVSDPRSRAVIEPFDPRIHFALNCAGSSCPPIAFYNGDNIQEQLKLATASFIGGNGAHFDPESKRLTLSKIFKWYQSDFGGKSGVRALVAAHLPGEYSHMILSDQVKINYAKYDWSVNQLIG